MKEVEIIQESTVLVVDDEANLRRVLSTMLKTNGYKALQAKDGTVALDLMEKNSSQKNGSSISAVISDLRMPGMDGLTLLAEMRKRYPDVPFIIMTAHGTIDSAVDALKNGAFDYITKPFDREELLNAVRKAASSYLHSRQNVRALSSDNPSLNMIGQSPQMQEIYQLIRKVADSPSSVLISGESGTGKELVARAIHQMSPRINQSFITINCGAIPETLIESELFGYERGAFTGANSAKPGRFELAHGGTLFLDEVGELPLTAQVKLLRAIQEKTFERVGGTKTIEVDIRLITATNRDLGEMVSNGKFREELYYRLNVVPIALPPLRDRTEDIPLLMTHFLDHFNRKLGKGMQSITEEATALLQQYQWPGNIRELENVMERMILLSDSESITAESLPPEILQSIQAIEGTPSISDVAVNPEEGPSSLKDIVKQASIVLEKRAIEEALSETTGNVTQAAKKLGISRKSLQLKMKALGLRK